MAIISNDHFCLTCTDAGVSPQDRNFLKAIYLKNGTNANMKVDGGSTPVDFSYYPPAGRIFYLHQFYFIIYGTGAMDNKVKFGPTTALANGIDILFNNSSEFLGSDTIKNNMDIESLCTYCFSEPAVPPPTKIETRCNLLDFSNNVPVEITEVGGIIFRVQDTIAATTITGITARVFGVLRIIT